jgi:ankyrin repeat protein
VIPLSQAATALSLASFLLMGGAVMAMELSLEDLGADLQGSPRLSHKITPEIIISLINEGELAQLNVALEEVDINKAIGEQGYTFLHHAVAAKKAEIILQLLIAKGAQPNAVDFLGRTALYQAATEGRTDSIRILLQAGANLEMRTATYGLTPLHAAVMVGRIGPVRILLEHGAEVNIRRYGERTPLYTALFFPGPTGKLIARLLILYGAAPTRHELEACIASPLERAAIIGDTRSLEEALKHGPGIFKGTQVLAYAAAHRQLEAVRLLVHGGVDLTQAIQVTESILRRRSLTEEDARAYRYILDLMINAARERETEPISPEVPRALNLRLEGLQAASRMLYGPTQATYF